MGCTYTTWMVLKIRECKKKIIYLQLINTVQNRDLKHMHSLGIRNLRISAILLRQKFKYK